MEDVEDAATFIEKDSARYAAKFVRDCFATAETLDEFAERARIVPEVASYLIREVFVDQYRLIFELSKSEITILAVVHMTRNLNDLWKYPRTS